MAKKNVVRLYLCPSPAILFAIAAIVMCAAAPALGNPVQITSGTMYDVATWTGYDPPFGWQLSGDQTALGGITYTLGPGGFVSVGDTINLSQRFSVSADPFRTGPSQQTVEGVTYKNVYLAGMVSFAATPAILTGDETSGLDTPFTMTGTISLFAMPLGDPFLTVPIEGRGTASLSLVPRGGMLRESSVYYRFAEASPTPEPATLTLLGGGLLLALARGKRRGRDDTRAI